MDLIIKTEPNPAEEEALKWMGVVLVVFFVLLGFLLEFIEKSKQLCLGGISDDFYLLIGNLKTVSVHAYSCLGAFLCIDVLNGW